MNTEFITKTAERHKGKLALSGGVGASALMVWCLAQFPTQREFDAARATLSEIHEELAEVRKQVQDIHTRVVVLDAIRSNEQFAARERYE